MDIYNVSRLLINVVGVSACAIGAYNLYTVDEEADIKRECKTPVKRRGSFISPPGDAEDEIHRCADRVANRKSMYMSLMILGGTVLAINNISLLEKFALSVSGSVMKYFISPVEQVSELSR